MRADAWDAVTPVLRAAGHSVEAVTRQRETLDAQVRALVDRLAQVATTAEPVALVGHSAAGPVVAMAADHQAWAAELVAVEELEVPGLDTGHWPMLTAPRALGALIVRALAPRPARGP